MVPWSPVNSPSLRAKIKVETVSPSSVTATGCECRCAAAKSSSACSWELSNVSSMPNSPAAALDHRDRSHVIAGEGSRPQQAALPRWEHDVRPRDDARIDAVLLAADASGAVPIDPGCVGSHAVSAATAADPAVRVGRCRSWSAAGTVASTGRIRTVWGSPASTPRAVRRGVGRPGRVQRDRRSHHQRRGRDSVACRFRAPHRLRLPAVAYTTLAAQPGDGGVSLGADAFRGRSRCGGGRCGSGNTGMAPPMPNSAAFSSASTAECIGPMWATVAGQEPAGEERGDDREDRRRTLRRRGCRRRRRSARR